MNSILIWNINQRANYGGAFYPTVVLNLLKKDYDIIIFNEFYKHSGWESKFLSEKYLIETSENGKKKNEIAIFYNKRKYSMIGSKYTWLSDYDTDFPDYLEVSLKDNYGKCFAVVGARILVNYYDYKNKDSLNNEMKARARQGKKIACRINELAEQGFTIIGGGDLNIGRRENKNDYWNKSVFQEQTEDKLQVIMPKGVSHQPYKGELNAGCPDLLFCTPGVKISYEPYDWSFVNECKEIYYDGKFTENIPVSYPDHAQIIADFQL